MSSKKALPALSFLLFLVFIFFSYLVAKETFTQIDFDTTVRLQDHISRRWDFLFSLFSLIGSAEATGLIWLGLSLYSLIKKFWISLLFLPLFFAGLAIEVFGKIFVLHPGPPHLFYRGLIEFNFPSHYVQTSYSYPSGHMFRTSFLISFIFLILYFRSKALTKVVLQGFLIAFVIIMIISRIYLGEHWLSDVIGGSLLGTSLGLFAGSTIPRKKSKVLTTISSDAKVT